MQIDPGVSFRNMQDEAVRVAFLSDVSRWVEQVGMSDFLPKENDRLRSDL